MSAGAVRPQPMRWPSCRRTLEPREQLVHGLICEPCTKTKGYQKLVDEYNARQAKRREVHTHA